LHNLTRLYYKATKAVAFLFILELCFANPAKQSFDYTCMWVVRNTILSERNIEDVVSFAEKNGIKHLFVQVRGRGDALYQSALVPRSALLRDDNYDPLATMIQLAHEKNIKVHAWVNVYVLWSAGQVPQNKSHLFFQKPAWFDNDGKEKDPLALLKKYRAAGGKDEGIYLAPHHPEVNNHLLAVFREIVAKYDIDGLHMDYLRYKDSQYGKNEKAIDAYTKSNGDNPNIFLSTRGISSSNAQFGAKVSKWGDYKRQAITDLVKKTNKMIKDVRPGCVLSAAVKPNLYEARDRFYQEWDVWLAAGYLDWAVPMNYTTSLRDFAKNIDIIYDNLPEKYRKRIIMGVATYNQKAQDTADKIKYTRITRFPGVALFSYSVVGKNPRYMDPIRYLINQ